MDLPLSFIGRNFELYIMFYKRDYSTRQWVSTSCRWVEVYCLGNCLSLYYYLLPWVRINGAPVTVCICSWSSWNISFCSTSHLGGTFSSFTTTKTTHPRSFCVCVCIGERFYRPSLRPAFSPNLHTEPVELLFCRITHSFIVAFRSSAATDVLDPHPFGPIASKAQCLINGSFKWKID